MTGRAGQRATRLERVPSSRRVVTPVRADASGVSRAVGIGAAATVGTVATVSTVATVAAARLLGRRPPGGRARWTRTNHAGRDVTLLEGPAVVAGAVLGAFAGSSPVPGLATAAAGALGLLDDLVGDSTSKGLGGHLRALRQGRVTTGAVKVAGLALTGLAVALAQRRTGPSPSGTSSTLHRLVVPAALAGVDAGVVAGTANLLNLLDLRPGRALKATVLLGAPLAVGGSAPAAAAVGAALAALPGDLAGRSMLGDTGANALGSLLGAAAVARLPAPVRVGALAVLVGLTLASERVSFTAVIESTPGLRELDAWGRVRPAAESAG